MNSLNLSHRSQLVAAALSASLATATLVHAYHVFTRRIRRKELDEEVRRSISALDSIQGSGSLENLQLDPTKLQTALNYDEELIREQLARNYAFFGEDGMAKIRSGRVVVVGCGGVGSWAAVMLVRS